MDDDVDQNSKFYSGVIFAVVTFLNFAVNTFFILNRVYRALRSSWVKKKNTKIFDYNKV